MLSIGIELRHRIQFASADRSWLGEAFYHHSLQAGTNQYSGTHATFLRYQKAAFNINWNHEYVGKDYTAVLGFIPRQQWRTYDVLNEIWTTQKQTYWRPSAQYFFYPKKVRFLNTDQVFITPITWIIIFKAQIEELVLIIVSNLLVEDLLES